MPRSEKKWYAPRQPKPRQPKPRQASTRLGPDTERAYAEVRRVSRPYAIGSVYLTDMEITGLPDMPANLDTLMVEGCTLRRITRLPTGLTRLFLRRCPSLEDLPTDLPAGLLVSIQDCPMLPVVYNYQTTTDMLGFDYQLNTDESSKAFKAAWAAHKEEKRLKREAKVFCYRIREELVAAVMHPRRIEALIEAVGLEAIDDIYGQQGGFSHLVNSRRPRPLRCHPMMSA